MAVVCALGNNKRRLSADGTAAPFRHPRASRSGADQAHTQTEPTDKTREGADGRLR